MNRVFLLLFLFFVSDGILAASSNAKLEKVLIDLHNKQSSNYFNGWILSKDVQYLETLANEVKNEK